MTIKKYLRILIVLVAICLFVVVGVAIPYFWQMVFSSTGQQPVVSNPTVVSSGNNFGEEVQPSTEQISTKETVWVGDLFGLEEAFPGIVEGPAIAELWNPTTGFCALVEINVDESLDWEYPGSYWKAFSAEALAARWPHHEAEYQAKKSNEDCSVFLSAKDIPQQ